MKHINLYQAAFHPPRAFMPARHLLMGGVVFLCGLLALYAWDAWRLAQLRREVSQLTQRAAHLETRSKAGQALRQADPRMLAEAESLEVRLRNLQRAQDALASGALGSETGYAGQFRALARARVAGAWLTQVEIDERGHAMNLRGRALTGEDSAHLIASLRREPLFVGLSFAGLAVTAPEDQSKQAEGAPQTSGGRPVPPRFLEFALSARLDQAVAGLAAPRGDALPAPKPDAHARKTP
jgi:hypothetical protein